MIGLYVASLVMGVSVAWAVSSVRVDYASRQTLTARSVGAVWTAYVLHAVVVVWAAELGAWSLRIPSGLAHLFGSVLIVAGIALAVAAIVTFRSIRRMSGLQVDALITSGVYAWSRNPQNLGWGLALLGVALRGKSGFALLLTALFALAIHAYLVLLEEPYLQEIYGDAYRRYRARTGRYCSLQGKLKSEG